MKALLLAAGLGTRLRPITERMPKCLVPIHGKPLLDYWFELLLSPVSPVERLLVNTSYLAEQVERHVALSPWRDRVDLVHETALLGTGGTVLANRDYFGGAPFMVVHADNLSSFDPAAFVARHQNRPAGTEITMMTFATDRPQTCGIVALDKAGVVRAFHEKVANPPGNLANGAVYIFEPTVLDFIARLGKPVIDISTEVLPAFIDRISTFHNATYHRDIGSVESLALAEAEFSALSVPSDLGAPR